MTPAQIFTSDVLDRDDTVSMEDGDWVTERGVVKMVFASAFHNPCKAARQLGALGRDVLLLTARKRGYAKSDLIASSFAQEYPPSRTAKDLANDLADFLGKGGVFAALHGVTPPPLH